MNKALLVSTLLVVGGFFLTSPATVEAAPPPIISVVADPNPGAENQGVIITLQPLPGAVRYGFVFVSPPEFGGSYGQYLTENKTEPVESGYVEYIPKFRFNFWGIDENGNRFGGFDEVVLDNPNYVAPQPPVAPPPAPTPAPAPQPAPQPAPVPAPEVSTSTSVSATMTTSTSSTTSEESDEEEIMPQILSTGTEEQGTTSDNTLTSEQVLVIGLVGTGAVAGGAGLIFAANKFGWLAKLMSFFKK